MRTPLAIPVRIEPARAGGAPIAFSTRSAAKSNSKPPTNIDAAGDKAIANTIEPAPTRNCAVSRKKPIQPSPSGMSGAM